MKPCSPLTASFLAGVMDAPDTVFAFADLFTISLLQTGQSFQWTNTDRDITYADNLFSANAGLITGLKMKQDVGLSVDRQQITVASRPDFLVNGAAILASIAAGAWQGASITRERVFMASLNDAPVGGVNMFTGRVATVDLVGRTNAKITVVSDLVLLDMDMPKNLFSPTCLHVLYDAGCTLSASSVAIAFHQQGYLVFNGGANDGIRVTVKSVVPGVSFSLAYPMPDAVSTGDTFLAFEGCAHTQANCQNQFANLINFRAFPFVPPPQIAF